MISTEFAAYDLSRGLEVKKYSLLTPTTPEIVFFPGESLMPTPIDNAVHESVHNDLYENHRFGGAPGQRVHYAVVNDHAENSTLTILCLQWGGKFQEQGTEKSLVELVSANPDSTFLVYDNLGYGRSDKLHKSALKQLSRTGRFNISAEVIHKGISGVIAGFDKKRMLGRSLGGFLATEMAPLIDDIDSLVVFDTPATPVSHPSLINGFARTEKSHGRNYLKAFEAAGYDLPDWDLSPVKVVGLAAEIVLSGALPIQYNESKALSWGEYDSALATALPHIRERYVYLSPKYGAINISSLVRAFIANAVEAAGVDNSPPVVDQLVFNGTHAFGYGNHRSLVALEKYGLDIPV